MKSQVFTVCNVQSFVLITKAHLSDRCINFDSSIIPVNVDSVFKNNKKNISNVQNTQNNKKNINIGWILEMGSIT